LNSYFGRTIDMGQQQIETPWKEGYAFGVGVEPGGASPMGLVVRQTPSPPVSPGGETTFNVKRTRTTAELQEHLQISAEASGGCGLFSASLRFDYAKQCKVQSESLFMAVVAHALNAFQQVDDAVLTDDAVALTNDRQAFADRYGTYFVRGLRTGGIFVGVVQVDSTSKEEKEHIAGSVEGSYAAFQAKVSAASDSESKDTNEQYSATLYFEGGDRAAITKVFDQSDPKTLFDSAKAWLATVGSFGEPYHVTLAPIAIARGGPQPPDPAQLQHAQDVLVECARQRASLLDGLNLLDYVLAHEPLYGFTPETISAQALASLKNDFEKDLDLVAKCASNAMQDPKGAKMPTASAAIPGNMPVADPAMHAAWGAKGRAIADANPLVAAIRSSEPDGPVRSGFDAGMGIWAGNKLPGPTKAAFKQALTPSEQLGFADAEAFSFQWNNNTDFAAKGAAIADKDPRVAAARAAAHGATPDGLPAGLYWLGFDIATGLFGDPALGGQGDILWGPEKQKILDSLNENGKKGFQASMKLHLGPPPLPRRG
jgi:hypothetical protein